jgi:glycosyltransferase 2 family protein
LKKAAILFLKVAIPLALFTYLLWRVDPEHYRVFWEQPKRWDLMAGALASALLAIIVGILRWRQLVLAFQIPFTPSEALRLGFLGYLLNFISFGSVGGDLFKAILVAKDKPKRRPEAVASVLLDRAIGLLGLILLASISLIAFSGSGLPAPLVLIRDWSTGVAIASIIALLTAIYAGAWFDRLIDWGSGIPLVGETLARMARALRLLRHQHLTLLSVIVSSVCVHALLSFSVYLISCGAYTAHPSLTDHLKVVPPALAAGALPLAPGGLGYQEAALANLFETLPDIPAGYSGMLVATIYRLVTIVIAGFGLPFYWAKQAREVQNIPAESVSTS